MTMTKAKIDLVPFDTTKPAEVRVDGVWLPTKRVQKLHFMGEHTYCAVYDDPKLGECGDCVTWPTALRNSTVAETLWDDQARAKAVAEAPQEVQDLVQKHNTLDMTPSATLSKECVGVRVSFNWYRAGKQVDKITKQRMAEASATGEDAFSAGKRLFDSKHPVIKEANQLKSRIDGLFKGMTLPLAAFAGGCRPEPGLRLINLQQVAEFDKRMQAFVPEVTTVTQKVNAALPDIKEMDAKRLKGLYRDEDYPDAVQLDFSWGYVETSVPAALERLSPELYQELHERESRRFHERMEQTIELATSEILKQFLAVVEDWQQALGPVIRIYPPAKHPHSTYHGAEVRQVIPSGDYEVKVTGADGIAGKVAGVVPEDHVALLLRYYPPNEKRLRETVIGPMSKADYQILHPSQAAGERRTFQASTIENMGQILQMFRSVRSSLPSNAALDDTVAQIERHLSQLPTTDAVTKELKDSATFRSQTHALMTQAAASLQQQIVALAPGRRKVSRLEPKE